MPLRTPSPWPVAALAIAIGTGVGAGAAALRSATHPWLIGDFRPGVSAAAAESGPRVETTETEHAFGTIGMGATGSHEFVIRNAGAAPLSLTKGATSCTCTIADFDRAEGGDPDGTNVVPPGGSTKVRIEWKGKGPGPFRQRAAIFTNDPRRPQIEFTVDGTVMPTWKAVPDAVIFSRLSATTGDRAEVRIFTFGAAPPQVVDASVDHPQAAQFFSLATSPLPAAEVAAEPGATGGLLVTVEIRPGLPLGPLRQKILLDLRLPEAILAELPLDGTVAGDLALAGAAWDSSVQVLSLGTVSGKTGLRTQMFLTAKGPHRDAVRPVVREVVPGSLQVEIGESKPVGSGGVMRTPLTIVVPPGSPPANNLCSEQAPPGRIVLDTGHPDTPSLTIRVCIAIGP